MKHIAQKSLLKFETAYPFMVLAATDQYRQFAFAFGWAAAIVALNQMQETFLVSLERKHWRRVLFFAFATAIGNCILALVVAVRGGGIDMKTPLELVLQYLGPLFLGVILTRLAAAAVDTVSVRNGNEN